MRRLTFSLLLLLPLLLLAACTPDSTPDPGQSGDNVPDALASLPTGESIPAELVQFRSRLVELIRDPNRDYEELKEMLGNPFIMTVFGQPAEMAQINEPTPAIAALISSEWLPDGSAPGTGTNDPGEVRRVLGEDPYATYPDIADALYLTGFGPDGAGEAVLIIAEREGVYTWDVLIYAPGGFNPMPQTINLAIIKNLLVQSLDRRDYRTLAAMMYEGLDLIGDPDGLYPVETAIAALQETYLASESSVQEINYGYWDSEQSEWTGTTYEDVLGYDIRDCCGAGTAIVGAVQVSGWGFDGSEGAVLTFVDSPVGFVWHAIIELK